MVTNIGNFWPKSSSKKHRKHLKKSMKCDKIMHNVGDLRSKFQSMGQFCGLEDTLLPFLLWQTHSNA